MTEKTRQALEKLTQTKMLAAMPVRCADKKVKPNIHTADQCFLINNYMLLCSIPGGSSVYKIHPVPTGVKLQFRSPAACDTIGRNPKGSDVASSIQVSFSALRIKLTNRLTVEKVSHIIS